MRLDCIAALDCLSHNFPSITPVYLLTQLLLRQQEAQLSPMDRAMRRVS